MKRKTTGTTGSRGTGTDPVAACRAALPALFNEGLTDAEIAERFGLQRRAVQRMRMGMNLVRGKSAGGRMSPARFEVGHKAFVPPINAQIGRRRRGHRMTEAAIAELYRRSGRDYGADDCRFGPVSPGTVRPGVSMPITHVPTGSALGDFAAWAA
ncbi:MAG TPA: hypothetical protein VEY95_11985 [Azospirillaceae bacterium]|nr:hypothetical protein [Azospirillaceae bacterium]